MQHHPLDLADAVEFFGAEKTRAATISLSRREWLCVLKDEEEMEGSFFEFLIKHVAYRTPEALLVQLRVVSSFMVSALQLHIKTPRVSLDEVVGWIAKWMTRGSGRENTLVVPYGDDCHWSIFVVEKSRTYHIDPIPGYHGGKTVKNFLFLVHLSWAQVLGHEVDSPAWSELVFREATRVPVERQEGSWVCGYISCWHLRNFIRARGCRGESDHDGLMRTVETDWRTLETNRSYHKWFLESLYAEVVFPERTLGLPTIGDRSTRTRMPMSTDEEEDELLVYDRGERPSSAKKDDVQVSGVLATRFPERRPQKLDCTKDRHEVKVDKPRAKK